MHFRHIIMIEICWKLSSTGALKTICLEHKILLSKICVYHKVYKGIFFLTILHYCKVLHGPSMFTVKAKIYGVSIINSALLLLMKHLLVSAKKLPMPRLFIGHHTIV